MKKYDAWKIIMTLVTVIFIVAMVILNVWAITEEKNSRTETAPAVEIAN